MDQPASTRRPPLRDVAALAHVSEPTVSRVLNGRSGVANATRTRVLAALAELGYTDVPEPGRVRRGAVGIVSPELTNPVFPRLIHEIAEHLAHHGTVATVGVASTGLADEARYLAEFADTAVDGLVLIGGSHALQPVDLEPYTRLIGEKAPLVLVNGAPVDLPVPQIRCDEARAAERATDHLVSLGHERIGCLLGPARYHATTRFIDGFERAAGRHGLATGPDHVAESVFTREGGRAGATRLLDRGMTAVICGNDLMALGAVAAARAEGLSVPQDFSVVGYDGTDFTATSDPPLTTLRQPFAQMGALVADAVAAEIDGSDRFRDSYVFTPELLARNTTGPAPR
ncbi:MAG: LacI family DNA-binding transcriptional regulator [Actinomycetota bacterium]